MTAIQISSATAAGFMALIAVGFFASTTQASGAGSADAGRSIAEKHCAGCHAISGTGPSPVGQAPLFRSISRAWPPDHLREAFAEGVMVGHGPVEMPTFEFDPDQIDDLVAYLDWLAER